jgi:hypothetical protein
MCRPLVSGNLPAVVVQVIRSRLAVAQLMAAASALKSRGVVEQLIGLNRSDKNVKKSSPVSHWIAGG